MKKVLRAFVLIVFVLLVMAACEKNTIELMFNTNGGEAVENIQIDEKAKSLDLPTPKKAGYSFEGWFLDNDYEQWVNLENILSMGRKKVELFAKWAKNINTLTFDPNGGQGQMEDMEIPTGEKANLIPNNFEKEGYAFAGWAEEKDGDVVYLDGDEYTMGTDASYTLYAVWIETISISFNANGGQGTMSSQTAGKGLEFKLKESVFSKSGHIFYGWALSPDGEKLYNDEGKAVFEKNTTLYAKWLEASELIEMIDDTSFYLGYYPQTVASEEIASKMPSEPNNQGYYVYEGERYVKQMAQPRNTMGSTGSLFASGEEIQYGREYFFKVEKIKWIILEEDDDGYFVVSDMILDKSYFGEDNNWENSLIREWLNGEFLARAFEDGLSAFIKKHEYTTHYWLAERQTVSTRDKVVLLSNGEIRNKDYGFVDNMSRTAYVSDYAKAVGVWTGAGEMQDNPEWQIHTGMYLLRSAEIYARQGRVDTVRYHGGIEGAGAMDDNYGVRPAMIIKKV
ncbi:MAG: InlB B-repeat-containing protein [Bacillota bacterium]|jgi:uncharacterized repeat protein (TIGR02543 family)|nr:InlB B-repeat-containing protein [Bacillota bacterium]HHU43749.1 InlB B-repeat-containing protein [Clostridiales bacterium]